MADENLKLTLMMACIGAQARGLRIAHEWGVNGGADGYGLQERYIAAGVDEEGERHVPSDCVCPMGAVLLFHMAPLTRGDDQLGHAAEALGVDPSWVGAFLDGYDKVGLSDENARGSYQSDGDFFRLLAGDPDLVAPYELGCEMRELYAPDVYK